MSEELSAVCSLFYGPKLFKEVRGENVALVCGERTCDRKGEVSLTRRFGSFVMNELVGDGPNKFSADSSGPIGRSADPFKSVSDLKARCSQKNTNHPIVDIWELDVA